MSTQELTIEFRGICTHFRKAVPGVPHRVVLPETVAYRPGRFFTTGAAASPYEYLLEPHRGHVFVKDGKKQLFLDAAGMKNGWLVRRLRFRVANAVDDALQYPETGLVGGELPFSSLPHLTEQVVNFRPADDVCLGGEAQCYFDFTSGGTVTVRPHGAALRTVVRVKTDGPPQLEVTGFDLEEALAPTPVAVPPGTLIVGNTSSGCKDGGAPDYLWHLLTGEAGIPIELPRLPYGFDGSSGPGPLDRERRKRLVKRFGEFLDTGFPGRIAFPPPVADNMTDASCSNSQWP